MGMTDHIFKIVFDSAPTGLAFLERNGEIIYANQSISRFFGVPLKDLGGMSLFDFYTAESRKSLERKYNGLLDGSGGPVNEDGVCRNRKTGEEIWTNIHLSVEYDKELDRNFILAIVADVHAIKTEREILVSAKEEAEKLTKTKSDFLANMSHEIRTPIHTIMGMNELLLETQLDDEQQEYGQQVAFSAEVLLSLINDILDFSKIEAGKLEIEVIDFDLFKVTEGAVDMVSLEAHKKGLEVCLHMGRGIPHLVKGDPVRLRQIIVNLFNNAVKFTPHGEIAISVELLNETDTGVTLKFSVRDSGIGIEPAQMNNLFQSFTQADSSTTRKFGGSGLGLSICRNLAEMMGGKIGVDSEPGKGSTFWFNLPYEKQGEREIVLPVPAELQGKKVLLVDENETARMVQRDYLEEWGCLVEEAVDGTQALEMLKTSSGEGLYDFCLIDLELPGMDGWQLASEINANEDINKATLILMSPAGKSAGEAKMKLLRWFKGYLTKPLKKSDLLSCLSRFIGGQDDLESADEVEELEELPEEAPSEAEEHPGKGLILVAEDHEVNQQLFRTILASIGYDVDLANNGAEAVEAVKQKSYGVIFMDVQMPEMNGYEAAAKIREMGMELPIIAATANAVKSEQDKCFEVGMNDILLKPFKKKDVISLLTKWMGAKKQPEKAPEQPEETAVADPELYIFNVEEAVETFLGKKDVVQRVVKAFIDKVEGQLPVMKKALEEGKFDQLRGEAHSIKGGAWNLEIRKLGDKARDLEDSSRENKRKESRIFLTELEEFYREFAARAAGALDL